AALAEPIEDPGSPGDVPQEMPPIDPAFVEAFEIDRGSVQQFPRVGEVSEVAVDFDILTWSGDRAAGLDAQLDMGVPMARAPGSQKNPELIGFTNLELHRTGRELPADPHAFAVRDGSGLSGIDEAALRNMDGRRPSIHDCSLPVISYSSLTLTLVFDHFRSYQFSVRIRRNAACDFSPWASAGPVATTVTASPAAKPRAQSLPAWRLAWRASELNNEVTSVWRPSWLDEYSPIFYSRQAIFA